jgi:hypothetical protein
MRLEIIFSTANFKALLAAVIVSLLLTGDALAIWTHGTEVTEKAKEETEVNNAENEKNIEKKGGEKSGGKDRSRLTDEYIPLQLKGFPQRPRPILEIGQNFLGTGTLAQGIKLPTGAVWQPYFMLFGTLRTGLNSLDIGDDQLTEWANRFDLFGNLYLTFTERILIGFRPLDRDGRFTGVTFAPEELDNGFEDEFNFELTTLFFEGEFGEIFPNLDKNDKHGLDFGFSVGRQIISFQEGMLINDIIDAVGITKINWKSLSSVNFRWTLLYGWNQLNRANLPNDDNSSSLIGLFTETDWRKSTVAFDIAFVNANDITGDGLYMGLSAVQRMGKYNTAFRVLGSVAIGDETIHNSSGALLFSEISWTPHGNHNLVYVNGFLGIDNFRSASRDPTTGGPLGRTGILFAAVGLGRFGAALSNDASESFGGSLGYQMFFAHTRQQLILELGGRYATNDFGQRAIAGGARYQIAVGRRWVLRFDGFTSFQKGRDALFMDDEVRFGGRFEILTRL